MRRLAGLTAFAMTTALVIGQTEPDMARVEQQFRELPREARRLTGPLFWLHGDESQERLEMYLERVAESGNGSFTAESRPHKDWLGEGWYRDLAICLNKARQLDLKMWIFDEKWWPSQMIGGKVPPEYGSKTLVASATPVEGPKTFTEAGYGGRTFIGAVAGKVVEGGLDSASLVDLAPHIQGGTLTWEAPAGAWRVMRFTWAFTGPKGMQQKMIAVDGASPECVAWYIQTVYQPHYDRFKDDFGKTIPGFFYDEPETLGDWGSDVMTLMAERGVDWKKALVAWKVGLAGEEQVAAKFQYADAFAEAWGRTMYGGLSKWCREHKVVSMGHFMEHNNELFSQRLCAGNLFQLQKYSGMGGIDLVCRQFYPGQRKPGLWQMAKLGSSITHAYDKPDDITMCEMFGAYGQDITYPQMKWLTDQMQVRGVNFMIPHSFNPRAPYDTDCPPYFYNGGFEPRYPLHRVYCDYTSRLSVLLTGGRHVAPVAFLFPGQSLHAGKCVRNDALTDALDDALFDCDWVPYDAFEERAAIEGRRLRLHKEDYRVLVVPPAEVIPYATLAKAKDFFDKGGVVVGYDFLPAKSATLGKTAADIAALRAAVWGEAQPGLAACKTSAAGGRSYFLPAKPTPEQLQQALAQDAGVRPALEVVKGDTGGWLHVLHRVKDGCDVFLVCNQNHTGEARAFTFRVTAAGEPECWDAMRNEVTSVPCRRIGAGQVEVDLTLEPSESAALVFQKEKRARPVRLAPSAQPAREAIRVVRGATPPERVIPSKPPAPSVAADPDEQLLPGCEWVWGPEGSPVRAAPPGTQYFRGTCALPAVGEIKSARFIGTCDNQFTLFVNGKQAGQSSEESEGWRELTKIDVTPLLAGGANVIAIAAKNLTDKPSPAGLIGLLEVVVKNGAPQVFRVDAAWRTSGQALPNWNQVACDDAAWPKAKSVGKYGCAPWGLFAGEGKRAKRLTASPVTSDPFVGHCELPADVNVAQARVFIEMDEIAPEEAARVTVNGQYAGGFIGKPFRLEVTRYVKPGPNAIVIEPFTPKNVRLTVWPK